MPALTQYFSTWCQMDQVSSGDDFYKEASFLLGAFWPWWFVHVPSRSKPVKPEKPLAPVDLSKIADPWGEVVVDGWPFFFLGGQHRCIDGIILYIHMFHFSIVRYTTFKLQWTLSSLLQPLDEWQIQVISSYMLTLSPSLICLQESKLSKWFKEAMIYHAGPRSEAFATFLC